MKKVTGCVIIIFGYFLFGYGTNATENSVPRFTIVSSRSFQTPPSIEVVFPNGIHDELVLDHYKLFKGTTGGHNYLGYLKNSPGSTVAVTGDLSEPDGRMEITLISEHNIDRMFEIDYLGRTKAIPSPLEDGMTSRSITRNRKDVSDDDKKYTEDGDEEVDPIKEAAVYSTEIEPIPSKLKAVIKFGYTEGLVLQLKEEGKPEFPEYIETVMVHAQARYLHPSLGTQIHFEVQEGFLYNANTSWCAEGDLGYAREATNDAQLVDVDATSWYTASGCNGGVAGRGYLSNLCNSLAVTICENLSSYASNGFVLAHELGHNFGMNHDFSTYHGGDDSSCNGQGTMSYDFSAIGFSPCSRYDFEHTYAEEFWGHGCLEDISRPCTEFTCENGGSCTETDNEGFICNCPDSVTGSRCENTTLPTCKGGDDCCSSENKCKEWEGDCDSDSDCNDGLICGYRNCPKKYGYDWDFEDDCCFKPTLEITTTCPARESGTCVFPFYYKGIQYNNCAFSGTSDSYDGVGWCSFDTVYSGSWGYCTSECPSGKCQATSPECYPSRKGQGANGTCVFPFKYDYRTYSSCADPEDYAGVGWCAFDSDYSSGRWGYCTSSCPMAKDDPCDGVVCNIPGETCVNGMCRCGALCSCEGNPSGEFCDPIANQCKCSATVDCEDNHLCDTTDGTCHLCVGGEDCCTNDNQCDVGEGDCDSDSNCKEGLKCGSDNCGKCEKGSTKDCGLWHYWDDCCYDPTKVICTGGDSCCTAEYPCGEGQGDCDSDSQCKEGLKCGTDNCQECLGGVDCSEFESGDDCCYDPAKVVCTGGDSCCTTEYPCGVGEGDCDSDSECDDGLECGKDNCRPCLGGVDCSEFESSDDCCFDPNEN